MIDKNLRELLLFLSGSTIFSYTSPVNSFQRDNGKSSTLETVLRLQGLFRHRLHPLGVSPLQASILLYLDRHPQCEVMEIASALCLQNLSAVKAVQLIQRQGWIRKPQVNSNRKIVKLQLTAKGTALARKIKENIAVTDKLFALADSRKAA
ncbi:MAG: MarR family transcriptional regulator [Nitrospira sp.]